MKLAPILLLLFITLSSKAQFLKKLKEQAEKKITEQVNGGKSDDKQPNKQTNNERYNVEHTVINPNFTYLNNKQAADKYGTKIYTLPKGRGLLEGYGNINYWVENNQVKYYFSTATWEGADPTAKDQKVHTADGSVKSGTAQQNGLPFTQSLDKTPPILVGYNSFEEETSEKNYALFVDDKNPNVSITTTTVNYLPQFTLTVKGQKMGTYKGMMHGVYSYKSGKVFYLSSLDDVMPNTLFVDGRQIYKSASVTQPSGLIQTSPNGAAAVFMVMFPDKIDPQGRMSFIFSDGHIVAPFQEIVAFPKLMNSGELLELLGSNSKGYRPEKDTYRINDKTLIEMPEKSSKNFFSDETCTKWAQFTGQTCFFSDGIALYEPYEELRGGLNGMVSTPKKLLVNGKSQLVWLQVVGNDIYFCKKEL